MTSCDQAPGSHEDGIFQYRPLDLRSRSIRLLLVRPENDTSTIECDLCELSLDDSPTYIALSYTWDHASDGKNIKLNGKSSKIGRNLWTFLQHFRRRKAKSRALLWIDALCIDQANIGERNHQVAQMRDIYAGAHSAIVWLGSDSNGMTVQLAFDLVDGPKRLQLDYGRDLRRHRSKRQWEALYSIFDRPYYWSRVWVIQEFILARSVDIWCGDRFASLHDFERLFRWLKYLNKPSTPHAASCNALKSRGWTLSEHRSQWQRKGDTDPDSTTFTLKKLLQIYAESKSSDIRDKVYALLGIACDVSQADCPIIADYAKSTVEVLVDVIRNQCKWSSPYDKATSAQFVGLLCQVLDVSFTALNIHLSQYSPELEARLSFLATDAYVQVPLRCLGMITTTNRMCKSNEHITHSHVLDWPLDWKSELLEPQQPRSVSVEIEFDIVDAGTQRLMSMDVSKLCADEIHSRHYEDFVPTTVNPELYGKPNVIEVVNRDIKQAPHGTYPSDTQNDSIDMVSKEGSQIELSIFVGTKGLIGITTSLVRSGDIVLVEDENTEHQSAIIMRKSANTWRWNAVGMAIIPCKSNTRIYHTIPEVHLKHGTHDKQRTGESQHIDLTLESTQHVALVCEDWQATQTEELVHVLSIQTHINVSSHLKGFTVYQERVDGSSIWKVRPKEGCKFSLRQQKAPSRQSRWLRLFCPPSCLPQMAQSFLFSRIFIPRFSGIMLDRGPGGGVVRGIGSIENRGDANSDAGLIGETQNCNTYASCEHHEFSLTSDCRLVFPNVRPDWRTPDSQRRHDDD